MKIAISAGETSGDEHGAGLAKALIAQDPSTELIGMGGSAMRAAGVTTFIDSEKSASVMGFKDVILSIGKILNSMKEFKAMLREQKPDLLILVDYPDFNLRMAKYAKSLGIKTLYFIPPKLWAWRTGRVKLFKKFIDKTACIFPFEPPFFESKGYNKAVFVGHPFSSSSDYTKASTEERKSFRQSLKLDPEKPVLAIFPGSRKRELLEHMPILVNAIKQVSQNHPEIQTVIAAAPNIDDEFLASFIPKELPTAVYKGKSTEVLRMSDAGVIKSGTSNLQAAFAELPFAMFYRAGFISEFIGEHFIPLDEYSIVNIIKPKSIRELLKQEGTASVVAKEIEKLLFNEEYRAEITQNLEAVVDSLNIDSEVSSYQQAASVALSL